METCVLDQDCKFTNTWGVASDGKNKKCADDTFKIPFQSSEQSYSAKECDFECIKESTCKEFMLDKSGNSCTLY